MLVLRIKLPSLDHISPICVLGLHTLAAICVLGTVWNLILLLGNSHTHFHLLISYFEKSACELCVCE